MELSIQSLPIPDSTKNMVPEVTRRSANYHPSIWGDHFLTYASLAVEVDVKMGQQLQQQKEEVRKMLLAANDQPSQKLNFIDAIQRLGMSYHFESEMETALQHIYETDYDHHDDKANDDLYTVALLFRLLRQQGYPISCDVFNKFKDDDGKICESLIGDVRGMLSLYEAAHLRVRGEDILDEALSFTITHLESAVLSMSNLVQEQVIHALNQPIHMGLTRLEATRYFFFYEQDDSHNEVLLNFAKLDFNLLQKMHQWELSEITRWWKELDFAKKMPFARDRIVECYFWILGVYFEPQYLLARRMLTKVIALTSIIDDIYDVYGTLEELVLFTDAIERFKPIHSPMNFAFDLIEVSKSLQLFIIYLYFRWEISAIDQLPEYMKPCYQALLDVYNMIDEEMARKGRSYCVHYAKSAMKILVRAYFEEAKWFHQGNVPSIEEYMRVALVTGAYTMLATTSLVGMGEVVSKEAFDWVSSDPLIVQASSVVCRLMDDMVGHKFEQKRGHVVSVVECYMKQYGASEEEALVELQKRVTNAWKDINQECLRPTAVPMPLLLRVVNLARVINVLYKDEDGYTHSGTKLKGFVTSEVDVKMGQQLQQQKEEVRKMLVTANDQLSQKLNFINAIQRLGVSYHFESGGTELDFAKKMPFARDRIVECYFWILGVYFEPNYLLASRMLTKVTALTSIIDDIYDVYGTLEELVLFTDAIESAIDQLPEHMKLCYQALPDVYNMIDEEMARKGRSYRVHYAKAAGSLLLICYKLTICD
ncbi:(-)-germacrene D synthase [Camellia lanceoleosa]|uniref:(-)-germacrene D synthase n=1 Tax=Camellia lanceoleosa TaxID=1840588 RepID=A0ACC0GZY2_9ERIC|nr:(-)-germacrene D synthase [Camellia lanceoleosa]